MTRLDDAVAAIDAANAADPSTVEVRGEQMPLALAHGRLAAEWVERLVEHPSEELILAARAHHLRRFDVPRTTYPEGRAGYLRWRRDQKQRHAVQVGELLANLGYDPDLIERVQGLVRRDDLGTDAGAQVIEDAACLAFLETQLADVAARLEADHLARVLRRTADKMSAEGRALVDEVPLDADARRLLAEALAE